jgi:hypothetical protein
MSLRQKFTSLQFAEIKDYNWENNLCGLNRQCDVQGMFALLQ